jgi:hypothetical protein
MVFFSNPLRDSYCQKNGIMVAHVILFVASFDWIVNGKKGSSLS